MSKIGTYHTLRQLKANHRAYETNFKLLLENVGKPKHKYYVKIERELNSNERRIRRGLGGNYYTVLADPCKAHYNLKCEECNGYYKDTPYIKKNKSVYRESVLCSPQDKDAIKCDFKPLTERSRDDIRNGFTIRIFKSLTSFAKFGGYVYSKQRRGSSKA